MKAKFTNFAKGQGLNDILFFLPQTLGGYYLLDSITSKSNNPVDSYGRWYSLEQIKDLKPFAVKNEGTTTRSKYNTSKGFINRIKKEL